MRARPTIEVLRGRLDDHWSERLMDFWTSHGALKHDAARARLDDVVAVALDGDEIAGVCSVFAADVPLVGGRRFWVYRNFVLSDDAGDALLAAAFRMLDDEYDPEAGGPVGLLAPLGAAQAARRPEAQWDDPRFLHAGFLADGRQARIAYFAGAKIGPGLSDV